MPISHKKSIKNIRLWFWQITEDMDFLASIALQNSSEERLSKMGSKQHQKSFLATRHLLLAMGHTDDDLQYHDNGKPYLTDGTPISISHSFDFVAIAMGGKAALGVDIEKVQERVLKIAHKFVAETHREIKDIQILTAIWCAKEAMYKARPIQGISFKNSLFVRLDNQNKFPTTTRGSIKKTETQMSFRLDFGAFDAMVWCLSTSETEQQ